MDSSVLFEVGVEPSNSDDDVMSLLSRSAAFSLKLGSGANRSCRDEELGLEGFPPESL